MNGKTTYHEIESNIESERREIYVLEEFRERMYEPAIVHSEMMYLMEEEDGPDSCEEPEAEDEM